MKLRSHLNKYLFADDDQETVRQSRNDSAKRAIWLVELVENKDDVVRLKSLYGKYLTASDLPFLLGVTGKKVLQTFPEKNMNWKIEWQPIRDGFQVKLKTWCGTFLRGNGGTPPWRNSITHDEPYTGSTKKWILWDVQEVKALEKASFKEYPSSVSSFSSVSDEVLEALSDDHLGSAPESPISVMSANSSRLSTFSTRSPKISSTKQVRNLFTTVRFSS